MDDPFLRHLVDPENAGRLDDAHGSGRAGDPGCGAVIEVFIRFEGQAIAEARFMASGLSAAIAAGSFLTGSIRGKHWREAAALPPGVIADALSGNTGNTRENREIAAISSAAGFAIEALHGAFEDAMRRGNFPAAAATEREHVLVAMSGGVDSSVACLLEQRSGRKVTGITMRLWSDPACDVSEGPGCCSPGSIRDARSVCHALGLPHLTIDATEMFSRVVVDDFVKEYLAGRTPNPCAACNGRFRFPLLGQLATMLGASRMATGHYAQVVSNGAPGDNGAQDNALSLTLARGTDDAKDQSYMLWGIPSALLCRISLPLGTLTKDQTRRLAREAALPTHARRESQEICFIPDDDYRRFLRTRRKDLPGSGEILDTEGRTLGLHTGYIDYTVGQRRGLGVSAPEPLYVISIRPADNAVIAGDRAALAVTRLRVENYNGFLDHLSDEPLLAQVRYNSEPVEAAVVSASGHELELELMEPVHGVACGQSVVLYQGDLVCGGGMINATG